MDDAKLVLHVDQADHWPAAFANLQNVTPRLSWRTGSRRCERSGSVYAFVGGSDLVERLSDAAAKGVVFQVCRNTLSEHHIEQSAVPGFAEVVPAGVIALAVALREGFAYIKP